MARQIKIEILGDAPTFRRALRKTEGDVRTFTVRVSKMKGSVKVDANTRDFDKAVVRVKGSVASLSGKKVSIAFGGNIDRGEIAHKAEAVAKSIHPEIKVKLKADVSQGQKALKGFGNSVKNFNKTFLTLGNVVKLLKFPAIIAGANAAAGAVIALGAGAIEAAAGIGQLVGVLPAVGVIGLAVAQGAGVLKLAFGGIGPALKAAGTDAKAYETAMKKLPPAQRAMVRTLVPFKLELINLKRIASTDILPGLRIGMKALTPLFRNIRTVIGATAHELGGLIAAGGRLLGSGPFRKDFLTIGKGNVAIIHEMGKAGLALVDVFRNIFVTAQPLALVIAQMIRGWAEGLKDFFASARASGALTAFFARTRVALSLVVDAIGRFSHALGPIFKAALPGGFKFLTLLRNGAAAFDRWTHSARGTAVIANTFKQSNTVLAALGRLVISIVKNFSFLGGVISTSGLVGIIDKIATVGVPAFARLAKNTGGTFLKNLVDIGINLTRIFAVIGGNSGVLTGFVHSLALITGALASIIEKNAGFGTFLTATVALAAIGNQTGITALAGAFFKLGTQATVIGALNANTRALSGGVAQAGAGTRLLGGAMKFLTSPMGIVALVVAALAIGFVVLFRKSKGFHDFIIGALRAIAGAAIAFWAAVKPTLVDSWHRISDAATQAWHAIQPGLSQLANVIRVNVLPALRAFAGIFARDIAPVLAVIARVYLRALVVEFQIAIRVIGILARVLITGLVIGIRIAVGTIRSFILVIRGIVVAVSAAISGVRRAAPAIAGAFVAVKNAIVSVYHQISAATVAAWRAITSYISGRVGDIFNRVRSAYVATKNVVVSVYNQVKGATVAAWNAVFNFISHRIGDIFNRVRSGYVATKNTIVAVYNQVKSATVAAWNAVWNFISHRVGDIFNRVRSGYVATKNVIVAIYNQVKNATVAAWNAVWNFISHRIGDIFNRVRSGYVTMKNTVVSVYGQIKNATASAWNWIFRFISDKVGAIFNRVRGGFGGMFNTVRNIGSRIVGAVLGMARGIVGWINKVLNGINTVGKHFGVKIRPIDGFAEGGAVRGPGTGTSDSVLARVSKGEHIWTAREVKAAGGQKAVAQLREAYVRPSTAHKQRGPTVTGYQEGGPVVNINLIQKAARAAGLGFPGFASGGPAALAWAKQQRGKPYIWGGVGPRGYDCSGFMSAILNVIRGQNPYRRDFTTHNFTGRNNVAGLKPGSGGMFDVGITNAGVGHMAGTLMGVNVESSGSGRGVRVGGGARGAGAGMFNMHYTLGGTGGGGVPSNPFTTLVGLLRKLHIPDIGKIGGGGLIGDVVRGAAKKLVTGAFGSAKNTVGKWIANALKAVGSFFGKFFHGPGNIGKWISAAENITHTPANWGPAIARRIQFESGGNPNAQNNTDINARRGQNARGLMQVIPATFARYHQAGTSSNIFDPVANIAAALNYIKARYGSIFRIDPPRGGYKKGGPVDLKNGMPMVPGFAKGGIFTKPSVIGVGERGPEAVVPLDRGFGSVNVNVAAGAVVVNGTNLSSGELEIAIEGGLARYATTHATKKRRGGRRA